MIDFEKLAQRKIRNMIIAVCLASLLLTLFHFQIIPNSFDIFIFVISLIITIIANVSAYSLSESTTKAAEGVILDEMVIVKSSPDSSGTELTKIHEGLKVMIVDDTLADWVKIEANNGNRVIGWIKTKSMERI